MENKRKFPYYSAVESFAVKKTAPSDGAQPYGRNQSHDQRRTFQEHSWDEADAPAYGTDFQSWSEQELRDFLDLRGGDHDQRHSFEQLVERAVEVEINTGPAVRPPCEAGQDVHAPAAAVSAPAAATAPAAADEDDDAYDPLEAFMADIGQEVAKQEARKAADAAAADKGKQRKALACDDEYDPGVEYMQARKAVVAAAAPAVGGGGVDGYNSDEEVYATAKALEDKDAKASARPGAGYDSDNSDGGGAGVGRRKDVEALAPLEHTKQQYEEFAKDFYEAAPEIAAMSEAEVSSLRRELQVRVSGFDVPRPVRTFEQCGFDAALMAAIKRAGYQNPTAIQAQALPAALSGRDVLGIAKTGSGKTAAFVLPLLVHLMDQPELVKGEGPIGVVVAPTRELAEQIHKEARKFSKPYSLRVAAAFGGLNKYEQFKDLKAGSEIAVCTPGRMIDLVRMKACTMRRATYLVFDEADRMFDMGFEPQVRSIMGQVRPDRQTLLFSATMPRKIERLVTDAMTSPVRINVGQLGVANADVIQLVEVFSNDAERQSWLFNKLADLVDEGDVIIFAGQIARVDGLTAQLQAAGVKAGAIHGDMDQYSRMGMLDRFKSGALHVLVATDVAARGLDIKTIKTVVNFDAPKDIDTHIHRVGRTGRAGDKEGKAYSLLLPGDARFAGLLAQSLAVAGQEVPQALHELAMKDGQFRKGTSRSKGGGGRGSAGGGRGRKPMVGGAGLGFSSGPSGLSSSSSSSSGACIQGFTSSVHTLASTSAGGRSDAGAAAAHAASSFVELPGFAKASRDYEHEPSAAAASAGTAATVTAPHGHGYGHGQAPPGFLPPPPPLPPGASISGAGVVSIGTGTATATGTSSGVAGVGSGGASASGCAGGVGSGGAGVGGSAGGMGSSAVAAAAIAAAQAIAARLAAQAPREEGEGGGAAQHPAVAGGMGMGSGVSAALGGSVGGSGSGIGSGAASAVVGIGSGAAAGSSGAAAGSSGGSGSGYAGFSAASTAAEARSAMGDAMRSVASGRFRQAFVSSGTTGGDTSSAPCIVAPKVQVHKPLAPPPPVPVTQQPLWMRNQAHSFGSNSGNRFGRPSFTPAFGSNPSSSSQQSQQAADTAPYGSSSSTVRGSADKGSYNNMPPPASVYNAVPPPRGLSSVTQAGPSAVIASAQAAAAIAAAQAIAARLAAQAPREDGEGDGGGGGGYAPPPARNRWDSR